MTIPRLKDNFAEEYEKAFERAERKGKVVSREEFWRALRRNMKQFARSGAPQFAVDITGAPGSGKTSTLRKIDDAVEGVSGVTPVLVDMDKFLTTRRGSPERKQAHLNSDALLRHYCHRRDFQHVLSGIYALGPGGGKVPLGRRYMGGDFREVEPLEVPKGKKLVVSEGVLAGLHAPAVAEKHGLERLGIFLYAPTDLTLENALLRDLLDKGIPLNERRPEREKELPLLLPEMIRAMERADLIVNRRERLKEKIKERLKEARRRRLI